MRNNNFNIAPGREMGFYLLAEIMSFDMARWSRKRQVYRAPDPTWCGHRLRNNGFGFAKVSGRMRMPWPAAKTLLLKKAAALRPIGPG